MARVNPDGTITDDCPIGPAEKPKVDVRSISDSDLLALADEYDRTAGYTAAAVIREYIRVRGNEDKLKRIKAIAGEMDKVTHVCQTYDARCVGWRRRILEILGETT